MPRRSLAPLIGLRPWCGLALVCVACSCLRISSTYLSVALPTTSALVDLMKITASLSKGRSPHQGHSPVILPTRRRGTATAAHPAAKPFAALSQLCLPFARFYPGLKLRCELEVRTFFFQAPVKPLSSFELVECLVPDRVPLPILVIEMPPLCLIDGEAFRLHCSAQQIAPPTLERSSAGIIRV